MKFIKIVFNFIMFIMLLCLITTCMFIQCNKTLISRENISNFISDANILNVDVNILFNQEESGITLKEKIIDLALENNIPEEIVVDILESEQINQLLGDFFNQTITYIIEGGEKPQISEDSINNIKEVANLSLNDHINIMIEEEQLNEYIDNYSDSIVGIVPNRDEIIGNIHTNTIERIINFNVNYLYLAIALILVLILLVNKKRYICIKHLGLAMFISGIIFVIIGSMEYVISNLIVDQIKGMVPFVLPLITNVLTIWFKTGVLVSFSSIVIILIYVTLNRIYSK